MSTTVKERPILFSSAMIRALLAGNKTQTRRVLKPQPPQGIADIIDRWCDTGYLCGFGKVAYSKDDDLVWPRSQGISQPSIRFPYGEPGDRLWAREAWRPYCRVGDVRAQADTGIMYAADRTMVSNKNAGPMWRMESASRWRPSIHMPRWVSRITLEITEVRVERVQDISHHDALAEGVEYDVSKPDGAPVSRYAALWDSINGDGSWKSNPWVWCVSFKRLEVGNG